MSDVTPIDIGRNRKGQFAAGNPGGPGRPPGARNRLGEQFLTTLAEDFEQHGREAIEAARQNDPLGYVRMIASLMPKALEAHLTASVSFREPGPSQPGRTAMRLSNHVAEQKTSQAYTPPL